MDISNKEKELFCSVCNSEKKTRFCDNCGKETPNFWKKEFVETIRMKESIDKIVQRGDISMGYFVSAFTFLCAIVFGIISLSEATFLFKLISTIVMTVLLFWLCFFGNGFRNFVVGIFSKIKNHKEKF